MPAADHVDETADYLVVGVGSDVKVYSPDLTLQFSLTGHTDKLRRMCMVPGGLLATASEDDSFRVWNLAEKKCVKNVEVGATVTDIKCRGDRLLICHSRSASLYNTSDWTKVYEMASGGTVRTADFLADGNILTGSYDNSARIWSAQGNQLRSYTPHGNDINCVCTLPDGRVATGGDDSKTKIWNPSNGQVEHDLGGHSSRVWSLCPIGEDKLATGSSDKSVIIYNTRSGAQLHRFTGHANTISDLQFMEPSTLVVVCSNASVRMWNVDTGAEIRSLGCGGSAMCALAWAWREPRVSICCSFEMYTTIEY